jgi:gamma-glutamyltranspeptidase
MAGLNCTVNSTMDEILSPTIAYAEEGFPVSELVAYYLKVPYLDI